MSNKWLLALVLPVILPLAGYWAWSGWENRTQIQVALALASMAVVAALWRLHIQAERRWRKVLDAYAERAIAQHTGRRRPRAPANAASQRRVPMSAGR